MAGSGPADLGSNPSGAIMQETIQELSFFGSKTAMIGLAAIFAATNHFAQAAQVILSLAVIYAIVFPIRMVIFKPRPKPMQWNNLWEKFSANSLISVHVARATSMAIILSLYFSNIALAIIFFAIIPIVAISRFLLGKHKKEDLFFGFLLGLLIATAITQLIKF